MNPTKEQKEAALRWASTPANLGCRWQAIDEERLQTIVAALRAAEAREKKLRQAWRSVAEDSAASRVPEVQDIVSLACEVLSETEDTHE